MFRSLLCTAALTVSITAFAGETKKPVDRFPSSEGIVTVKATNLKQAWGKMLRDKRVMAAMKSVRATFRDCGGGLDRIEERQAMYYYSGKSGAAHHYNGALLPIYGYCAGTGLVDYVGAMAKIMVHIDMSSDDGGEENAEYTLYGFVKVNEIPIDAKDQGAGLGD